MNDASPPAPAAASRARPSPVWFGRLQIVGAAVLWSTSGFFAKAPLFEDWPGPLLAFWRAVFASLLLVPLVRRPRFSLGLVPMVLVFALMNFTYLTAMAKSEASLAIWLQNTAPAWVLLASLLWLGEPIAARDWWLFVCAAVGVGIILSNELRGAETEGVMYGLAAGATYAGVVLLLRRLRSFDAIWVIAVSHIGTALLLAPVALPRGPWPHAMQWVYLAGFGMLQMGLPYVLFARGLKTVSGHEAAGIALLEPLLVPLWVYLAWHHHPSYQPPAWWTLAGGACILVGLCVKIFRVGKRG